MEAQTQMKTLYAHENLLEKIEGLDSFLEVGALELGFAVEFYRWRETTPGFGGGTKKHSSRGPGTWSVLWPINLAPCLRWDDDPNATQYVRRHQGLVSQHI